MYTRLGIHELKPTPNEMLIALNPQVIVAVGTYEHGDAIHRHLARVRLLKQLLPKAVIGVRWWPDDHILHRMRKEEFASAFFKLHVPGTLLMVGNEDPNDPHNTAVFRDTVNKHIKLMRLATAEGIEIGTCCVSTGNPAQSQYKMLMPLFDDMTLARSRGVVHWWRPNAYFTHNNSTHVYRHHNEALSAAKLARIEMPPMLLGELGFVRTFQNPYDGYHSVGMSDGEYIGRLNALRLRYPAAIYSWGEGVYDNAWRDFAVTPEFMRAAARDLERTPLTAYEEWQATSTQTFVGTITKTKAEFANVRTDTDVTSSVLSTVQVGDTIEYHPNARRDSYGRDWHKLVKPLEGYVASWVLEIENTQFQSGQILSTKADIANVREEPSTKAEVLGTVSRGMYIEYKNRAEQDENGNWWHFLNKPLRGYIASWVVEVG